MTSSPVANPNSRHSFRAAIAAAALGVAACFGASMALIGEAAPATAAEAPSQTEPRR